MTGEFQSQYHINCLFILNIFLKLKKIGYGYVIEKNCTHQRYEDRINNLINFIFKNYPYSSETKNIQKEVGNITGNKILLHAR